MGTFDACAGRLTNDPTEGELMMAQALAEGRPTYGSALRAASLAWGAPGVHIMARVGGRFYQWSADETPAQRQGRRLHAALAQCARHQRLRYFNRLRVLLHPRWLEQEPACRRDGFDFPTWRVQNRPYDWAEDESGLPAPAPAPPWSLPDRTRLTITLGVPAPVVQR